MSELILRLYLKTILLIVAGTILFGWIFPAMLSAPDWGFVVCGILGMFATAPVFLWYGYTVYVDVLDVIRFFKEEKK